MKLQENEEYDFIIGDSFGKEIKDKNLLKEIFNKIEEGTYTINTEQRKIYHINNFTRHIYTFEKIRISEKITLTKTQ